MHSGIRWQDMKPFQASQRVVRRPTSQDAKRSRMLSSHVFEQGTEEMKLNRDLQHAILEKLAEAYPGLTTGAWREIQQMADEETIIGNLLYLEAHGLVETSLKRTLSGKFTFAGKLEITARGLDFLADDGGLSAILGVVTIRLHDDTLKSLIAAKIQASDLPQPDKKRWTDQLRSLPAETTKHLALKPVDLGLENAPTALAAIGTALGLGAAG